MNNLFSLKTKHRMINLQLEVDPKVAKTPTSRELDVHPKRPIKRIGL